MNSDNELRRILDATELEAACREYGGTELYVPQSRTSPQAKVLAERIGQNAADKMVEWAGGTRVYIPANRDAAIDERAIVINLMRKAGLTVAAIAKTFTYQARYSERNIQRFLSEGN